MESRIVKLNKAVLNVEVSIFNINNFRLIIGFGSLNITYVRYKIAEYV